MDDWGVLLKPEENLGVREVRVFPSLAYLDGCLPACVVDYIEQICLAVYNCFVRLTGGQEIKIQQALPGDDDEGAAGAASTEMETVTDSTRAALERVPDHIKRKDASQATPAGNASTMVATQPKPASPKAEATQSAKKGLQSATTFTVGVSDCNGKYLLTAHKRVFLLDMDVDASQWKGKLIRIEDGDSLASGWRKCSNPQNGGSVGIKEVTDVRSPELIGTATSLPRNSKWDEIDLYQ
jgi:hypothetical protein